MASSYESYAVVHGEELEERHRRYYSEGRDYLVPDTFYCLTYWDRIGSKPAADAHLHSEKIHKHYVYFKDNTFTLDGKHYRKIEDPLNQPFLQRLKEEKCPDEEEFQKYGLHMIRVVRALDEDWEDPTAPTEKRRNPCKYPPNAMCDEGTKDEKDKDDE